MIRAIDITLEYFGCDKESELEEIGVKHRQYLFIDTVKDECLETKLGGHVFERDDIEDHELRDRLFPLIEKE
jgi:hypothetical protein